MIKPFYNSKQIDRYFTLPQNELWVIYTNSYFKDPKSMNKYPNLKKHLDKFQRVITSDSKPYGLHRARKETFFKGEKIIVQRKCPNKPIFSYNDFDCYVSQTYFIIKTNRINLKYLVALLNSSLIEFWLKHKGKMQGNNYQIDKVPILDIPIKKIDNTKPFEILVDYIMWLKSNKDKSINEYVDNEFIATEFEKVIDAMVYELYFEKELQNKELYFIKYAEQYFKSIENENNENIPKIIHRAYQSLRERDNEIRNNLKLLTIRLKDLILPIEKSV